MDFQTALAMIAGVMLFLPVWYWFLGGRSEVAGANEMADKCQFRHRLSAAAITWAGIGVLVFPLAAAFNRLKDDAPVIAALVAAFGMLYSMWRQLDMMKEAGNRFKFLGFNWVLLIVIVLLSYRAKLTSTVGAVLFFIASASILYGVFFATDWLVWRISVALVKQIERSTKNSNHGMSQRGN